MRVVKRGPARQEMLDHFVFIGRQNPTAAERFFTAADEAFRLLAEMPGLGRHWASENPRLEGVRVWPIRRFKDYLIFYRPIRGGVEILHVLHGARDIEQALEEDPKESP